MPLDSSLMDDQKNKALAAALAQIEKQFGKGSIMKMGDAQIQNDLQVVSTGSLGLDIALGVGGLPRGRVVEIYGPESSGKTTLSLQVVAQVQKAGGTAAYIDAENALDPVYAGKLGVNVGDLLISQPDTGEQGLEIADMLVRSGGVDVIVIDSVAALVPKAEIEGEMGDQLPGLQARLMSQALRKLTANIKRANTLVIFINQIRMKIGVMFGNPETTTGGNALKFYASVRLDIRRIGAIKKGEEVVGNETRVKVVKNKIAPPFREALFDILYGEGISRHGEIIELGVAHDIIDKSGAWYAYNGEKIGQGKDNTREFLREHPEMADEIEAKIRAAVGVPVPGALRARGEPRSRGVIPRHSERAGRRSRRGCRRHSRPARSAISRAANTRAPNCATSSSPRAPRAMRPMPCSTRSRRSAISPIRASQRAVVGQKTGAMSKRAISAALKAKGVDRRGCLRSARRERCRRSRRDGRAVAAEIRGAARQRSRKGAAGAIPAEPRLRAVGDLQAAARSAGGVTDMPGRHLGDRWQGKAVPA